MGLITKDSLTEIMERADFERVFDARFPFVGNRDGSISALCCFHDDTRPSLTISSNGLAHCFACGWGGNIFGVVQRLYGYSFPAAAEFVAAQSGLTPRYSDASDGTAPSGDSISRLLAMNSAAAAFFSDNLLLPEAGPARDILKGRNFDIDSAIDAFGVGYALNDYSSLVNHLAARGFTEAEMVSGGVAKANEKGYFYDTYRGRIIWPIRDVRGQVIGFGGRTVIGDERKFINPIETYIYRKRDAFYGIDLAIEAIQSTRQVVLVEGYADVLAFHASGIHNVVAVNGTAFGADHARALQRYLAPAGKWGEVILAADGDAAGRKSMERAFTAVTAAGAVRVTTIACPDGSDPCDIWVAGGADALVNLYRARQDYVAAFVNQSGDVGARSTILTSARTMLATVADPVARRHWANMVAQEFSVSVANILAGATPLPVPTMTAAPARNRAQWLAVVAAVQYPEIVAALNVDEAWFTDTVLQDFFRDLVDGGSPDGALLTEASCTQLPCPVNEAPTYIAKLFTALHVASLESRIDAVRDALKKARTAGEDPSALMRRMMSLVDERNVALRTN
jgi:DNA primase